MVFQSLCTQIHPIVVPPQSNAVIICDCITLPELLYGVVGFHNKIKVMGEVKV